MENNIVNFIGIVECNPYNSPNYKIYGVRVDTNKYPNIKLNKYNNVSIVGDLHELGNGIEYNIKAEEINSKYGYNYKVLNIKRERPNDFSSTELFLKEILTPTQVKSLMSIYPDIVDRVINDRLEDIDLSKLYDIGKYRFEVIKRKIIENFALAELVEEFNGLISFDILKKLYNEYSSTKKIKQELKNNPYNCLCGLNRIGFKTADSILITLDEQCKKMKSEGKTPPIYFDYDLKTSEQRCKSAIIFLLEENENNGNTKISIKELREQVKKLANLCIEHFVNVVKNSSLLYYDKETQYISKRSTYETELYIRDAILEGLKNNIVWDYDINKYIKIEGFELTEEQQNAPKNICKFNISILDGVAGAGKSSSVKAIIDMLTDNNKTFELFAPTGRASKVLSEFTKREAMTIHRGLGYLPPNDWGYNENNKLYCDVVITDETSMVDVFIMEKLLKAIDLKRTKILIIGDSAQIPSVGAGNVLYDLINSKVIPLTRLTKPFRYGLGGITTIATNTRQGKAFLSDKEIQIFGDDKGYTFIKTSQVNLLSKLKDLYIKLLENNNPEDIFVLSSYNKGTYGTVEINKMLQPIANKNVKRGAKSIKFGDITFFEGDLVIQNVNNYRAEIYQEDTFAEEKKTFVCNGEIGKILSINNGRLIIQFDDLVVYDREDLPQLKLAYSISIHKSQGGQCKVVILLTPKAHTFMLNSNLLYVGQTRAKKRVYHLGEIETVNKAIKKKAEFNRHTWLKLA